MGVLEKLEAEPRGSRESVHNDGKHAGDVGIELLEGGTRLEPAEGLVAEVAEENLVALKLERGEEGKVVLVEKTKSLGHDADDLAAFAIYDEGLADSGRIAAEFVAPVTIGEDHSFESAGRIVFFSEGAAEKRRDAEERKGAVRDAHRRDLFGFGDSRDAD